MPPKTVLFNLKCAEIFEFAVGSKNHIRYNAQGSLICFGGFGNLQGHIEIWHRPGLRRLGHFQAQSSSICEWSPDGVHLLTATVTPRLRVDNGFKVWTLQGRLLTEVAYGELYGCGWRPMSGDALPTITLDLAALALSDASSSVSSTGQSTEAVKKQVYRPPGLRRKLEENSPSVGNGAGTSVGNGVGNRVNKTAAKANSGNTGNSANKGSTADSKATTSNTSNTNTTAKPVSKEERLVKKLAERLDQIGQLKLRMASGEALELNQIEKVEREAETIKEYEKAVIALRQSSSLKK